MGVRVGALVNTRRTVAAVSAAGLLAAVLPTTVAAQEADPAGPVVTRQVVESFDGTPLVTNLFLPPEAADGPVPLILETHGWAGSGRTSPGGLSGQLVDAGYAVLTSDARGFGCSGGRVRIDDPQAEGRDMSALIDWAVANHDILTGDDGDPVVGMIGGSYAGGIQTATSSIDPRIDAIAPEISWSDLTYSLNPGDVVKQGWVALLYAAGVAAAEFEGLDPQCDAGPQTGGLDPAIHSGITEFTTTGTVSESTLDFFRKSSLDTYGVDEPVAIPTLVMNGSVDTLFNVTDGIGIHEHVLAQGAPSRMMVFCGGHVSCPTTYEPADDSAFLRRAVLEWFDEHLRGADVTPRPQFEYRTNDGVWRSAPAVPTVTDGAVRTTVEASNLVVVPVLDVPDLQTLADEFQSSGGTLPANPLTAATVSRSTDPRATTQEVAHAADGPLELVGVPEVELSVGGALLDGLDVLPLDTLEQLGRELSLDGLSPIVDGAGVVLDRVPVAGGLVSGLLGGVLQTAFADAAPSDVHLFVKLVHRESGEVVNLQEGAVKVSLLGGPQTVPVRMPGVAYTIPEGDHLDVQISTASLGHATGRVPALVDVFADVAVPTLPLDADPGDGGPGDGGPGDGDPGDGGPGDGDPGDGGPGDGDPPGVGGPATPTRTATPGTTVRSIDRACAQQPATRFSDVRGEAGRAPGCLAERDITQGVGDGTRYDPAGTVTRAQMASFVVRTLRAAGVELPDGTPRFADVDPDGVHARNIDALAEAGIVRGRTADRYDPSGEVTREQMATFLDRAWDRLHPVSFPEPDTPPFRDLAGGVHDGAIGRLAAVGITAGVDDRGNFAPRRDVSRRQMASFLTRWLDHAVEQGYADPA